MATPRALAAVVIVSKRSEARATERVKVLKAELKSMPRTSRTAASIRLASPLLLLLASLPLSPSLLRG